MERREHDIFMDMLANPDASFDTMVTVGLTANNTSLQDRSVYEGNKYVQDYFKNSDGNFDKRKFENAYTMAQAYYNNLANADYEESMKKQATFHRDSLLGSNGQRESGPLFQEFNIANPLEQVYGFSTLGKIEAPDKSVDELAQSHKVLKNPTTAGANLENAEWGDSPNNSFFENFFNTLVLAQWDEEGEHIDPITGQAVKHEKGELKLNPEGQYYYEDLDGRDIYGRRVLNKMNVLTTDGSWANRFDPFDSDDVAQKSIGGSIVKNLALVGSMFIPYVGPYITGLSVATQLAGLTATLGKMLTGSDSPVLNEIEGWSKSVNRQTAKTDYAQQNTWCWENFISLIGDVAGQLQEQRFIFNQIPAILKGANMATKEGQLAKLEQLQKKYKDLAETSISEIEKAGLPLEQLKQAYQLRAVAGLKANAELNSFIKGYNKLGEVLSKGYMTAITVGDTYGEAKQAGASDIDATLLTLGYAAGEYALLNTGIGEWILPELRADKYRYQAIKKALLGIQKEGAQVANNAAKEVKQNYAKKLFNIGKNIARAEYSNGTKTLGATLAAGAGEGIEEVSEEFLADISKSCYDLVKWLQGSDVRIDAFGYNFDEGKWNASEVIDRYGMSLVGGAVGGSLTNVATSYKNIKSFDKMTSAEAYQELVSMHRNKELDKFEKNIDKSILGNKNLSATNYEVKDGVLLPAPGTETDNQDIYAKKALHEQCKLVRNILDAAGASISNDSILAKQTELLDDLRFNALHNSTTAGGLINEFNTLSARLVSLTNDINSIQNADLDANKDGVTTDPEKRHGELSQEAKDKLKVLNKELEETKKAIRDIAEGKRSYEFASTALFEMTTALSGNLTTPTYPQYVEAKYHRKLSELTDNEKEVSWKEYSNWKTAEGRDKIATMSQIFRNMSEKSNETIKSQADAYRNGSSRLQTFNKALTNLYNVFYSESDQDWLDAVQRSVNVESQNTANSLIETFGSESDKAEIEAIRDSILNIDKSLSVEEKETQLQQIKNDLIQKTYELIIDNIDQYIHPIISEGAINTEVKEQLINSLQAISEVMRGNLTDYDSIEYFDDMGNPTELQKSRMSQLIKLNNYIKQIESLSNTAFEKNLDEFSISMGNEPIKITELLQKLNEAFSSVSKDITRFNLTDTLYQELSNAINTIKMYQSVIMAARTDNAGFDNYFGYNATLNQLGKKAEGKYPELAEIDSDIADTFLADINTNLEKLIFLRTLYQINQGQKLSRQDRVAFKKDIAIYKRLKSIVTVPDDDPLKTWDGFLEFQNIITNAPLYTKYLDSENIPDSEKEAFEKEKLGIENAIYDFFQKNISKVSDPNKLVEFINPKRFQLYTEAQALLTEATDVIDDNSLLWYIAARAAIKSSDFYWQYHQIINPEEHIAPIATQEMAVFNNYAHIVNSGIFEAFCDAFKISLIADWKAKSEADRQTILENLHRDKNLKKTEWDKYAGTNLPIPHYKNIVFTEGIAGSGKTSAVLKQVIALLNKFNPEILENVAVIHGASLKSANDIKDSTLKLEKATSYDHDSWMKHINPSWTPYKTDASGKQTIPDSDWEVDSDGIIKYKTDSKILSTTSPFKLIIIDEISKFSAFELQQIQAYAEKYGVTVIGCGDLDQNCSGNTVDIKVGGSTINLTLDMSRTDCPRSPKLGVSMRTDNSIKTRNQHFLQGIISNFYNLPSDVTLDFEYYEDENGLYGDFQTTYIDQESVDKIKEKIDKLITTLEPNEKITYAYNSKDTLLYKLLSEDKYKEHIEIIDAFSAQGSEGRYYIIDIQGKNSDTPSEKLKYLKSLYTSITRAQQGSIIAINDSPYKFKNTKVETMINEGVSDAAYSAYANKRKTLLAKVAENGTPIKLVKSTTTSSPAKNPDTKPDDKTEKLKSGISPEVPETESKKTKSVILPSGTKKSDRKIEIKSFDSITDEETKKFLIELQKEATTNPTTEEMNENDAASDLKYGQIVESQGKYYVINGIKLESDGNHKYNVLTKEGSETKSSIISRENITSIITSPSIKVLTQQDLIDKYGDSMTTSSIQFKYKDTEITTSLIPIPFENTITKGEANIVQVGNYKVLLVQLGELKIPYIYYNSSWIPALGVFNGDMLGDYKGNNQILKNISEVLTSYVKINDTLDFPIAGTIGENFIGNTDNTNINNKWDDLETKISTYIDSIIPADDPGVKKLVYEDDAKPIVDDTKDNKETKNKELDGSTDTNTDLSNKVVEKEISDTRKQLISMILHSFNTFETGVLEEDGKPRINGKSNQRIDSINGLLKIQKLLGKDITINTDGTITGADVKNINDYKSLIGKCRSILFNIQDKAQLVQQLSNVLGLTGKDVYITFALKSSPRPGKKNKEDGREFVESDPTVFSKGISEETEYNGTGKNEWHHKSLVAIIGSKKDGDLVEFPLLALSSPITMVKLDNGKAFPKMFERFNALKASKDLYETAKTLYEEFKDDPEYQELAELFGLFAFTNRGISYIRDTDWTVAKNLQSLGPTFVLNRGELMEGTDLVYNADNEQWLTVQQFKENPQVNVSEHVFCNTNLNNPTYATPGHPFVLVSHDLSLDTDEKMMQYYQRQCDDSNTPKKVTRMYLRTPDATFSDWVDNIHNILTKSGDIKHIGQLFTSYHIFDTLINNSDFVNLLKSSIGEPGVDFIKTQLNNLNGLDGEELKNALYEVVNSPSLGSAKLAGLFDRVLHDLVYIVDPLDTTNYTKNDANLSTLQTLLQDNNLNIYYNAYLPRATHGATNKEILGISMFETTDYTVEGQPYLIHGKLDSPVFRGEMGNIIHTFMEDLQPTDRGHYVSKDAASYFKHKSDISSVENPKITALKTLLTNKGLDSNLIDTIDSIDSKEINVVQNELADKINSEGKRLAFIVNNELKITEENDIFTGKPLSITGENQISLDSTGKAEFLVTQDGKTLHVNFNKTSSEIEIFEESDTSTGSSSLESIIPELYDNPKIWQGKIEDVLRNTALEGDNDVILRDLIQAENLVGYLEDEYAYDEDGNRMQSLKDIKETLTDTESKNLIEQLIKLEQWEEQQTNESLNCTLSRTIKI